MVDIDQLKRLLVVASHVISNEGLAQGYGHVSARIPGTNRFIMPARSSPALVKYEDLLTFDLNNEKVEGMGDPMNETWLHTCVYRLRQDVNAVAHTHSPMVVVLSTVGQVVRPLHNDAMNLTDLSNVRLFTRPGLISTEELGMQAAQQLGNEPALMLRGHGAITAGPNITETCLTAVFLEECAKMQVWASAIGRPQFFTPEELACFPRMHNHELQAKRGWDFYLSRLSGR